MQIKGEGLMELAELVQALLSNGVAFHVHVDGREWIVYATGY